MALQLPRHKFTADEYQQMGVSGIFNEDDRVELLDGDIVEMSSLKLDVHWEPQPDVAVLRVREDDYVSGLRTGADVLLLIEVVDGSCEYDRAKLPAYARSGIPEVWPVDLQDQVLLSHRQPVAAEYRLLQALRIGESITPQALPEHAFSVASFLG